MIDAGLLGVLIFLAALLYASVGHGGASGYLAVMALMGVAPEAMRPAALMLNILVASIATLRFARAGAFSWALLWPFAVMSVPCAYAGGYLAVPDWVYRPLVGAVLLYSAWRAFRTAPAARAIAPAPPRRAVALPIGAGIGLLSGLTGVGGGIFLSPLMLHLRWADARRVSGVAAPFILVNSIAGIAGQLMRGVALPPGLPLCLAAAAAGGLIGAELGSRRLGLPGIQRALGAVLGVAGLKMISSLW